MKGTGLSWKTEGCRQYLLLPDDHPSLIGPCCKAEVTPKKTIVDLKRNSSGMLINDEHGAVDQANLQSLVRPRAVRQRVMKRDVFRKATRTIGMKNGLLFLHLMLVVISALFGLA